MAAAERRHRPKVSSGIVLYVQLRLHRPFATGMGLERPPNGVVGRVRWHRRSDIAGAEERHHRWKGSCTTGSDPLHLVACARATIAPPNEGGGLVAGLRPTTNSDGRARSLERLHR